MSWLYVLIILQFIWLIKVFSWKKIVWVTPKLLNGSVDIHIYIYTYMKKEKWREILLKDKYISL